MLSTKMYSSPKKLVETSQVVALALSEALDSQTDACKPQPEADRIPSDTARISHASGVRTLISWFVVHPDPAESEVMTRTLTKAQAIPAVGSSAVPAFAPLKPIRQWLDRLEVQDRQFAHFLCRTIPPQCPFERDVQLFGKTLFHIPPLCKLNPFYDEVVYLRFRAMSYLADECGEDVSAYC